MAGAYHLPGSEGSDGFDPDGDVQHLGGDQVAVLRAFNSRQLNQDAYVPMGQIPGKKTYFFKALPRYSGCYISTCQIARGKYM